MSGLQYILLLLVLNNVSSNPVNVPHHNQLQNHEYIDFIFPSNDLSEIQNTNTLKVYKNNPFAKPFKADNRLVAKFARRLNGFNNQLTNTVLASKPGENIIYSPLSILVLFMTIAFGARQNTSREILQQSGLDFDGTTLFGFQQLVKIMKDVKGVELTFANTLFASKDINILPDYQKQILTHFDSNSQSIDFGNTQLAAQEINDWCKTHTKNQITDIVNPDDLEKILLVLANVIYFKGDWMTPFDVSDTEDNVPFYVNPTTTVSVSMMYLVGNFNAGRIEELETRFIELPYVHDDNDTDSLSMYLFVPVNHNGLEMVEKNLHRIDFKRLDFERNIAQIKMPKFKIESSLDIKPIAQRMGIKSIFEHNADFRGLTENQDIYVDKMIQKAALTVNEKGSTAAAATVADFGNRIDPITIIANRPFICAIVLKKLGIPLFYARIVDPSTSG